MAHFDQTIVSLPPELALADVLRYAAIGMQVVTTLDAAHSAPAGATGSTPPIKGVRAGDHEYTIVIDWTKER